MAIAAAELFSARALSHALRFLTKPMSVRTVGPCMRHSYSTSTLRFAVAIGLVLSAAAVAPASGQTLASAAPAAAGKPAPGGKSWIAPRTADGRPDLGGVWANNNITPLERPKQWQGKTVLTEQELAELKRLAAGVVEGGDDAIFGDNLVLLALERKKNATSRDG